MGKNNKKPQITEDCLLLPSLPSSSSTVPIVDTHTHLVSTFTAYRQKFKEGKYETVFDFVRGLYEGRSVEAIVDVWCEAPVRKTWREIADSALTGEGWGGVGYWFVMGVHPHDAKHYDDAVERDILEAMAHPCCVGWGEMGLDYHYDNSPREVQQDVFIRQLRHAVRLGKPLTIHTREADEDVEKILKAEVPREHKIHVHCFTDSPELAQRLLEHFPNLYIGITGVITYSSNLNTSAVIRHFATSDAPLRILLETDAPYMVPANIYASLPASVKSARLPLSHTAMIPWTAQFVAEVSNGKWEAEEVLRIGRENARTVYRV